MCFLRCDDCLPLDSGYRFCTKCGVRQQILKSNPIELFTEYVLNQRKIFKQIIVIAHNSRGFDAQFILKHILENTRHKPELIMNGTKIIMMIIDNIKFLDSLSYFPMKLCDLPMAFDLPDIFKKGYFPHLFNRSENAGYVGPLPCMQYYSPDTMLSSERQKFMSWYETNKNETFNFDKELVQYCIRDVEILTEACLKFRQIMLNECAVCPFTEAVTIASACNLVYRRNFLRPETIGIIPKGGYRYVDKQSKSALKWLIEESERRKIFIRHAGNSREILVQGMKVDGFCDETKQIFEFQGCYYHGHTCITAKRNSPLVEDATDTLDARYKRTLSKNARLKNTEYELIEMWECQYNSNIDNNHPLLAFTPLSPRDAFYGGRTGNSMEYYKIKKGEKIKYYDICSLYPFISKYGKFPVGHPKVHIGAACMYKNVQGAA